MKIGIVKYQHIVPFHFPQSRQAVNLHFLFFRSFPNVKDSGSHNAFVYQNIVTGLQSGLHGIGGDAEGGESSYLYKPPNDNQDTYKDKHSQQSIYSCENSIHHKKILYTYNSFTTTLKKHHFHNSFGKSNSTNASSGIRAWPYSL